jgi:GT2 family glycosyltransferase
VGFARRWPAALWGHGNVESQNACQPFDADIVDGALWLVSRECLERTMELRGFYLDPMYFLYWEDADLCMFARDVGMRCIFDPQATAVHDLGASSGGRYNFRGLYYQSRNLIRFTCRWSSPVGLLIYLPMAIINRVAAIAKHVVRRRFRQAWAVMRGSLDGLRGVRWKSISKAK